MASPEKTRASANLLRGSLRDSVEACPEPEILAAYFERSLDADERRRYELHLSQCARCREELAAMHRGGEPSPAAATPSHTRSHWAWLWDWRFLAPAFTVLVIEAVWIARRPISTPMLGKSAQPLVAMNRAIEPANSPMSAPALEPSSRPAAQPPNKSLVAPNSGTLNAIKQAPTLTTEPRPAEDKKELASNQAVVAGNARELDALQKDDNSRSRDLADAASGVATAAPASPPPAPASRVNGGAVGGVITDAEIEATRPAAAKAKPSASPNLIRPMTGQEQRQAIAESEAVVTGAFDRRSAGRIVQTPDPKVMWRIAGGGLELSTDSGASWGKQQVRSFEPSPQITAGYAPSAKICWLVGRNGAILLTIDAAHWVAIPPPLTTDFVSVTAKDNYSATVTAADGRRYSTEDAGDHWKPAP